MQQAQEIIQISSEEEDLRIRRYRNQSPPRIQHNDVIMHRRPEIRLQRQIQINRDFLNVLTRYASENRERTRTTQRRLDLLTRELEDTRRHSNVQDSLRNIRSMLDLNERSSNMFSRYVHSEELIPVIRGGIDIIRTKSGREQRFSIPRGLVSGHTEFVTIIRNHEDDEVVCCICLDNVDELQSKSTTIQTIINCNHKICNMCLQALIEKWTQERDLTCPTCRCKLLSFND